MSRYASLAAMIARFGEPELVQLTDDAGTGAADPTKIDRAIGAADSMVDGYLASRHQLPLSTVPMFLEDVGCDIARFKLWRSTPPELVQKNYDVAIATLKAIADGRVRLDQGVETEAARPGAILSGGTDRIFGRDQMGGY